MDLGGLQVGVNVDIQRTDGEQNQTFQHVQSKISLTLAKSSEHQSDKSDFSDNHHV